MHFWVPGILPEFLANLADFLANPADSLTGKVTDLNSKIISNLKIYKMAAKTQLAVKFQSKAV